MPDTVTGPDPDISEVFMKVPESCRCFSCNGMMIFDIASQELKCGHCGTHLPVPEYDRRFRESGAGTGAAEPVGAPEKNRRRPGRRQVYSCASCGGAIYPGILSASENCPFCGAVIVFSDRISAAEEPDFIIPFQKDRDYFLREYRKLLNRRHFIPRSFRTEARENGITARYIPFWIYDVAASGRARILAEKIVKKSEHCFEHTAFDCSGAGSREFHGVPQDGTTELDDRESQSIEPYDMTRGVPFSAGYLSGLDARIANRNAGRSFAEAERRVTVSLDRLLMPEGEYDAVSFAERHYKITPLSVRYAMLPVWRLEMSYRGKCYPYVMNGQTGRLTGDFPVALGNAGLGVFLLTVLVITGVIELGFLADSLPGFLQLLVPLPMLFLAGGIWYVLYRTRIPFVFEHSGVAYGGGFLAFLITAAELLRLISAGDDGESALMIGFVLAVGYFFLLWASLKSRLDDETGDSLSVRARDADAYAVPEKDIRGEQTVSEAGTYISKTRSLRKDYYAAKSEGGK